MAREANESSVSEIFFDTTYLFPFFQVPIAVENFKLSAFSLLVERISKIHVAELSLYEAKAKLLRLSRRHSEYEKPLRAFGRNLEALRLDEKFIFHDYLKETDELVNQLMPFTKDLDIFDLIILSQAFSVGMLLTEDEDLLSLRDSTLFAESKLSGRIRLRNWKDIFTSPPPSRDTRRRI